METSAIDPAGLGRSLIEAPVGVLIELAHPRNRGLCADDVAGWMADGAPAKTNPGEVVKLAVLRIGLGFWTSPAALATFLAEASVPGVNYVPPMLKIGMRVRGQSQ